MTTNDLVDGDDVHIGLFKVPANTDYTITHLKDCDLVAQVSGTMAENRRPNIFDLVNRKQGKKHHTTDLINITGSFSFDGGEMILLGLMSPDRQANVTSMTVTMEFDDTDDTW